MTLAQEGNSHIVDRGTATKFNNFKATLKKRKMRADLRQGHAPGEFSYSTVQAFAKDHAPEKFQQLIERLRNPDDNLAKPLTSSSESWHQQMKTPIVLRVRERQPYFVELHALSLV